MSWLEDIEVGGPAWILDSDIKRMARVIRELAIVIDKYRQSEGYALFRIYTSDCSDDAKELLG